MTLISVIVPTYNRRHTLPRAVDSILAQTHRDLELIVVDDVSTDNTLEYLAGIDDPRLKVLALDQNGGAGRARNKGLEIASGSLVAYQDSDDEWSVRFLERLYEGLEAAGPEVGVIYCGKLVYGRDQQRNFGPGRVAYTPDFDRKIVEGDLHLELLHRPLISSQTFLVRRELMERVGGWHETIRKGEDWELSTRLARITRYAFIEEPLAFTQLSPDSATHNELKGIATMEAILEANRDVYEAHPALHAGMLLRIARTYQRSKLFDKAAPYISQAAALGGAPRETAKIKVAQALKLGAVRKKRAPTPGFGKPRKLSAPRTLVEQHRYLDAAKWKLAQKFGVSSIIDMEFGDETVSMRAGTYDFSVARSCLTGEFDDVIAAAGDVGDGLIIDAGGYIGTAAIAFAKAFPKATIVTLEPSVENFAMLKRNIAKFPNIVAVNKAIGAERGHIELQSRGTGEWGFTIVANPKDRPAKPLHKVEIITVDDVLEMIGKDRIAIFKIDIEGGEVGLLGSNNDWIARTQVLCAELHDRIIDGCTSVFNRVTEGRENRQLDGEKIMSLG